MFPAKAGLHVKHSGRTYRREGGRWVEIDPGDAEPEGSPRRPPPSPAVIAETVATIAGTIAIFTLGKWMLTPLVERVVVAIGALF